MKQKLLRSTYEGKLQVGDIELTVAVLEDGSRVIKSRAIFQAFGRRIRGRSEAEAALRVPNRPSFIDAKNVQPLISPELEELLVPITYEGKDGKPIEGYNALILPQLCKVYLDARAGGILFERQLPLARASEILLVGLSNIGIIALIDEATGYQYDRERDELQKILKAYINEALLPWQRRFPNVYYKELFRLNGWDFSISEITRRRPSIIGLWTNQFIYEQLPKDVLKTLKEKTPKNEAGQYKAKFHQSFIEDIGHPGLQNQISSVVALMGISDTMDGFRAQFERLKQRRAGQLEFTLETGNSAKPKLNPSTPFDTSLKALLNVPPPKKDSEEPSEEAPATKKSKATK
ncbi:P63C domain-containing protein [Hymenobacter sp. PAMC 26628]|uniref:P63C domain-containing protein n=1 Tax=Hymenobacter sp. PAMC 26628 TaxID=1484118 RepID=UPI000902036D|nr:P63C domain-containing protein [Hymenobacter sp. PAMC 26628]